MIAPAIRFVPFALFVFTGCAGALPRAEAQFAGGDYPDAKQALVALEAESRTWNDGKRAEYALYRGLTHAALGDREQAGVWLRQAKAIEDAHAGSLSYEDAQRLKVAFESNDGP
ncbi:MAG TPA: hypothetical protein VN894_07000 [Polyangiaceae bacterium]|nr:hypothetical protein [Polyangiaceae bacterium]